MLASTGGLDRSIEREDIRLAGYLAHHANLRRYILHGFTAATHILFELFKYRSHLLRYLFRLLRIGRVGIYVGSHLLHGAAHLLGAASLRTRTLGYHAARVLHLPTAILQLRRGIGQRGY